MTKIQKTIFILKIIKKLKLNKNNIIKKSIYYIFILRLF